MTHEEQRKQLWIDSSLKYTSDPIGIADAILEAFDKRFPQDNKDEIIEELKRRNGELLEMINSLSPKDTPASE